MCGEDNGDDEGKVGAQHVCDDDAKADEGATKEKNKRNMGVHTFVARP
jgi:hypothetical protein